MSWRYISSSIGCDNVEANSVQRTGDGGTFGESGDLEVYVEWSDVRADEAGDMALGFMVWFLIADMCELVDFA